ncbi:MAG: hypothetical protein IKD89_00920 [Clostridia bacterium]|nr:hypothetical protein [Clostridia bacterium]
MTARKWLMRIALIACLGLITFLLSVFASGDTFSGISDKVRTQEYSESVEAA